MLVGLLRLDLTTDYTVYILLLSSHFDPNF